MSQHVPTSSAFTYGLWGLKPLGAEASGAPKHQRRRS